MMELIDETSTVLCITVFLERYLKQFNKTPNGPLLVASVFPRFSSLAVTSTKAMFSHQSLYYQVTRAGICYHSLLYSMQQL